MNTTKYKIQRDYTYGWDDVGDCDSGEIWGPFDSTKEAQEEIDDLIADIDCAVARGDVAQRDERDEYRIVPTP